VTTALVVVSETGTDMSKFPSDKHFASWLGLCPGTPSSTLFRPPARCQRPQRVTDQVVSALKISISEKSCSGRRIDQP
jgi:hypothetical protein